MSEVTIDIAHNNTFLGSLEVSEVDDFPLALSISLASIQDITKRSGISSKSFRVPASKHNNLTLQHLYQMAVAADTVINGVRAIIKVDGAVLFTGKLQVSNLTQTLSPQYYELEFAADNLDWVAALKELKLNQLEFNNPHIPGRMLLGDGYSNEQLHHGNGTVYYTRQTAEASWFGSVDTGWDYVYSLKNYGQWRHPHSHITLEELRPDIYYYSILQKAFAQVGYRLESSFIDSAFFKRLVFPFVGNSFQLAEAQTAIYNREMSFIPTVANTMVLSQAFNFSNQLIDLSRFVLISGNSAAMQFYTDSFRVNFNRPLATDLIVDCLGFNMNQTGVFDISIGMKVFASDNGTVDVYLAKKDPQGPPQLLSSLQRIGHFDVSEGTSVPVMDAYNIEVERNQDYVLLINNFDIPQLSVLAGTADAESGFVKFTRLNTIKEGNPYNLASTLPDIPVLDILTGLANLFNLYIQTDNVSQTVKMETRKEFYQPYNQAVDWSYKLDVGKDIQTTFIDNYKRELQFQFKDDGSDAIVKQLKEQNRQAPGSLSHTLPKRYKEGKQQLGNKLIAYTEMRADNAMIPNGESAATYVPHFWGGTGSPPEPSYQFAPRVLYYAGLVPGSWNGNPTRWGWYRSGNLLTTYPVATRHAPNHELAYNTTNGFVAKYYQDDIQQLTEGKLLTAYFNLSLTDIKNLDLSRPVYLNHPQLAGYYWLQTLHDYVPTRKAVTKVELVPIPFAHQATIDYNQQVSLRQGASTVGLGSGIMPNTALANNPNLGFSDQTPSVVLQNGSNNIAVQNSGSIALGNGTIAMGRLQHAFGNYNVASNTDVFQVGAGTSPTDRYRALTFTQDGNFLVQGGYLYTSDGREIMFASQRSETGQVRRFDKLHLKGNE